MGQCFTRSNLMAMIEQQAPVKQINKRRYKLHFFIADLDRAWRHQACPQVSGRFGDVNFPDDILLEKQIHVRIETETPVGDCHYRLFDLFHTLKSTHIVKINVTKLRILDHLAVKSAFDLHHQEGHLIVRTTWKQYLACVGFVQCTPYGLYIQGWIWST